MTATTTCPGWSSAAPRRRPHRRSRTIPSGRCSPPSRPTASRRDAHGRGARDARRTATTSGPSTRTSAAVRPPGPPPVAVGSPTTAPAPAPGRATAPGTACVPSPTTRRSPAATGCGSRPASPPACCCSSPSWSPTTSDAARPPWATTPATRTRRRLRPPTPPPRRRRPLVPVTGLAASDLDPQGDDGAENPDRVSLAVDGDPTTAWSTSTYRQQLGPQGLKTGVGLVVDLGSRARGRGARPDAGGQPHGRGRLRHRRGAHRRGGARADGVRDRHRGAARC